MYYHPLLFVSAKIVGQSRHCFVELSGSATRGQADIVLPEMDGLAARSVRPARASKPIHLSPRPPISACGLKNDKGVRYKCQI